MKRITKKAFLVVAVIAAMVGCDDRVAQVAREGADRQARQNETMAGLQHEVAEGSRKLVEEQGAARRQGLELQRDLQADQAKLSSAWNDLEGERRRIAAARLTDSWAASMIKGGAATLAGILGLAFAYLTMFGLSRVDESAVDASEFLLEQLSAEPDHLRLPAYDPAQIDETLQVDCSQSQYLPPPSNGGEADDSGSRHD